MDGIHDALQAIYGRQAAGRYGLTAVSQLQHALQAAAIAERAGEGDDLVVAALLHDVGHMIHDFGDDPARRGVDDRHEARGARFLARWFDDAVVRPIASHVAAKRYLCAVDPAYPATLSDDSVRSLALQGGPMSAAEARAFEREPGWQSAVRLRRFDEAAKDPAAAPPPFEHFLPAIQRAHAAAAARRARSSGDA